LSDTTLAEWFFMRVFTARYGLSSYMRQTHLAFKGLSLSWVQVTVLVDGDGVN